MSFSKRDHERLLIHTHPKKKNPEEDEFTESEQELISGHDEPQTIQTDFRKCE